MDTNVSPFARARNICCGQHLFAQRRNNHEQQCVRNIVSSFATTFKSFSLFLTVKIISKLNLEHSDKFKIEIQKLAVVVHVFQATQNLVISRC